MTGVLTFYTIYGGEIRINNVQNTIAAAWMNDFIKHYKGRSYREETVGLVDLEVGFTSIDLDVIAAVEWEPYESV